MILETAMATQAKNSFDYYLNFVMDGGKVMIAKKRTGGRTLSFKNLTSTYSTDSLTGILEGIKVNGDEREIVLKEKQNHRLAFNA